MSIESLQQKIRDLPSRPGVYLMHDAGGKVIYVGKARSLKKRVQSYLRHKNYASPRLRKLVSEIEDISVIRTESDAEAFIVESRLIKHYQPFYNVELKMGERYPYVKITDEPFPRLVVTRHKEKDGGRYIGPFVHVGELRRLLRLIERYMPLRTCTNPGSWEKWNDRPCVRYSLGRCLGPCARCCDASEYKKRVADVILLLRGQSAELTSRLRDRMEEAAAHMAFEEAARIRDTIRAIWKLSRQRVSTALADDVDESTWKALLRVQYALDLAVVPWRIDGFDISHHSGNETYGSCVVFEQGLPNPSFYRRFRIISGGAPDDFRSIRETVLRRYRHVLGDDGSLPQLVLIDGGPQQLRFAEDALKELGLESLELAALAKREELLFRPGKDAPVRLEASDPALRLLQRIRDEAHRFALSAHRGRQKKRLARSSLEDIPGIGKVRAAELLAHFGSIPRLVEATEDDLAGVKGISKKTARRILEHLRGESIDVGENAKDS
ncbi:MAG: excinuclease ABC subunit UvrC [Thermovirgaceae bacterium]